MGLLSIFKRSNPAEAPTAAAPDAVAAARSRARQRLIGAAVLLGIGVIGFPLLFETQPRPIAVDIAIEIPRKEGAALLVLPPAAPTLPPATAAVLAAAAVAPETERSAARSPAPAEIVEQADDGGRDTGLKPPTAATARAGAASAAGATGVTGATAATAATAANTAVALKPAASKPTAARPADDGARAQLLLNGQAASTPAARVAVQVGAFSDADKLREIRQKLEKLGLKTYIQVVEVDGVKRTRVRVGPFESRADADKAAARIKAAGLPVVFVPL
jgi:DedD protein